MLKSKKLVLAVSVFAFAATAFFGQEVSFENTVSTDVLNVTVDGGEFEGSFAGIENETVVDFTSDKLDFGLDISFFINAGKVYDDDGNVSRGFLSFGGEGESETFTFAGKDYDSWWFGAGYAINDYYIEYRPIDLLGIGFHKSYTLAGSYLPVEDDNVAEAGNIGSDLGVFVRPIDGLVIAGGLDFTSLFGGRKDWANPYLNFGAEYEIADLLAVGASFRDIINDERSIGVYVSFIGVEGLTINGGFTYNGSIADVAGNLVTAGAVFEKDAISIGADAAIALGGDEDEDFDLYLGASFGYQISEPFGVSVAATFKSDFDADEDGWELGLSPAVTYSINDNNEIGAGVDITIAGSTTELAFPVYWTYSF